MNERKAKGDFWNLGGGMAPLAPLNPPMVKINQGVRFLDHKVYRPTCVVSIASIEQ